MTTRSGVSSLASSALGLHQPLAGREQTSFGEADLLISRRLHRPLRSRVRSRAVTYTLNILVDDESSNRAGKGEGGEYCELSAALLHSPTRRFDDDDMTSMREFEFRRTKPR